MYRFEVLLEEQLVFLQNEQKKCREELAYSPEGKLRCYTKNYGYQYIHAIPNKKKLDSRHSEKIEVHAINSKPQLIQELARKEYLIKLDKCLKNNIKTLEATLNNYEEMTPKSISNSMNKACRTLPIEIYCSNNEKIFRATDEAFNARMKVHEAWANEPYERNNHPFNEYEQWTSEGLHVRSMREQTIAEMLYAHKIPFRYDQVIRKGEHIFSPDFTFQDENYNEFYLEYCGMMDNIGYLDAFYKKRAAYESVGINEWTNMIYVFSTGRLMDTRMIESIIQTQIIPRL